MMIREFFKTIKNWVMRKRDDFPVSMPPPDDEKPNDWDVFVTHCYWEDAVMQTEPPVYMRRTNRPARISADKNFSEYDIYS